MPPTIHKGLRRNLGIKVLSVLLAVLVWILAAAQEKTEVSLIVPVELANIPDTLAIEGSSLQFVHLRLRGSQRSLQDITPQQVSVSLDLSGLKPGDNYVPVGPKDILTPRGVEIVNVSPQNLSMRVAARRLVPVKVTTRGKPAEGYQVGKVSPIPNRIYVIGPPHKVSVVREVSTVPIGIRGASATVRARAELINPDPDLRLMELKPTEVVVEIEGVRTEKVLRGVAVESTGDPAAEVRPDRVTVTVTGPFNLVEPLRAADLKASVDPSVDREKTGARRVRVQAPEGIEITNVTPPGVQIMAE
jgi:YbbR domain-containing protein